ncbi:unnamed protein product [Ilex paraguariensis]|uniref:Uncharacterized protein n=1 Tax=Ilex paraguariensis TaxID=185542 RepID=A0ABC8UI58_9AQUA
MCLFLGTPVSYFSHVSYIDLYGQYPLDLLPVNARRGSKACMPCSALSPTKSANASASLSDHSESFPIANAYRRLSTLVIALVLEAQISFSVQCRGPHYPLKQCCAEQLSKNLLCLVLWN